MLSHLIERSIDDGKKVFDFLKGDETYKFRLGAQPRPLFEVADDSWGILDDRPRCLPFTAQLPAGTTRLGRRWWHECLHT